VIWHYKFPDEEQLKTAYDDIERGLNK
jgi:hypothetical protein